MYPSYGRPEVGARSRKVVDPSLKVVTEAGPGATAAPSLAQAAWCRPVLGLRGFAWTEGFDDDQTPYKNLKG